VPGEAAPARREQMPARARRGLAPRGLGAARVEGSRRRGGASRPGEEGKEERRPEAGGAAWGGADGERQPAALPGEQRLVWVGIDGRSSPPLLSTLLH
jgi:hypothetical protein